MRLALLCGLGVLSACHDDGLDSHACPIEYHGGWKLFAITGEHTEPRQCPVFITGPTVLETGATFVDSYDRNVNEAFLLVRNAAGQPKTQGKTVIFGTDQRGRWVAPIYEEYAAGTSFLQPDRALFDLYADNTLMADADMTITYSDAVQAVISGPSGIAEGETHTWTASVQQGVAPFTYRWYLDWDLISTDASITLNGGAQDMELRLDVTDARGEAVSASSYVTVTHCSDPKAELC